MWQFDAVLRALGAGHTRLDSGEIELEINAVVDLPFARHAEHSLGLEVVFKGAALFLGASRGTQEGDGLGIDREDAHGGPVFRRHIRNGGAVGEGERLGSLAVEFDEFADDLCGAKHLGHAQGKIGCGDSFAETAREVNSDNFRREEIDRLSEHSRFSLDAADTPANYAETIDHGGVGIGADQTVRIVEITAAIPGMEDAARQIFKVHLMDNTDARRNNPECFKCLLAPFQKFIAFAVALEFHVKVQLHRVGPAIVIDLHGVIDDEIDRNKGFDNAGLAAKPRNRTPHGCKIDKEGNSGEVL